MRINQAGLDIIKRFEGCELTAYLCPAGVWTIGYGHTGDDAREGMSITQARADELLRHDLTRFERAVSDALGDHCATENQFSAMVSLAFNIGRRAFEQSNVLRLHRLSNFGDAANAFLLWNRSKGKRLPGLARRREAERALYLSHAKSR